MTFTDHLQCRLILCQLLFSDLVAKMKFLDDTRLALQKLSMRDWNLVNENYLGLDELVSEGDRHHFPTNIMNIDVDEQLELTKKGWQCMKKYKLKEDLTQPSASITLSFVETYVL